MQDVRHYTVPNFQGKLGIGLSNGLQITQMPESSICHSAGIPVGSVITNINGFKVLSKEDVGNTLQDAVASGDTQIVVSVMQGIIDSKQWKAIIGTAQVKAKEPKSGGDSDSEEEYDPDAQQIKEVTSENRSAYHGMRFAAPPAGGYDSPGSEDMSDGSGDGDNDHYYVIPRHMRRYHDTGSRNNRLRGPRDDSRDRDRGRREPPRDGRDRYDRGGDNRRGGNDRNSGRDRYDREGRHNDRDSPRKPSAIDGDPEDGLHPCLKGGKKCTDTCKFRYLPVGACMHFAQNGTCQFSDSCRWMHLRPGAAGSPGFPYNCDSCDIAFSRRPDMQRHLRTVAHEVLTKKRAQQATKQQGVHSGAERLMARFNS
eukprot:TRINITY_DN1179_c2_g1_i2.p1 TRINITY_DN1179_c2_g1~~TRINITY_DN1179_c2_g1_i2.p1  ORF type:complete len:368 (+),score=49.49 TRINITY_DN1179_c2_g1_i2:850-1953(+)